MFFMQEMLRNFFLGVILRILAHAETKSSNACGSTDTSKSVY